LTNKINEIKVFDDWNVSILEYEENFDTVVDSIKKSCLEKLEKETLEKLKVQIKELLHDRIDNISDNFWYDFNKEYTLFSLMSIKPFKQSLIEFYKLSEDDTIETISKLEDELYNITFKTIEKKAKDLSTITVEKFKQNFWYEESLPRKWQRIEETKIDELFVISKKKGEALLLVFNEFKLLKNPLKICKYYIFYLYLNIYVYVCILTP